MLMEYFAIPIFVVTGVAFVVIGIAVGLSPLSSHAGREDTDPHTNAASSPLEAPGFGIAFHYYIYALIFSLALMLISFICFLLR